jgi:hypothetical protein
MATSNLPLTGVHAVVEDVQAFIKDIRSVNTAIENTGKVAAKATKEIAPVNKTLDGLNDQLKKMVSQSGPTGKALGNVLDKVGAIPPAALLAVGAIAGLIVVTAALTAAFLNLGNRGAPLQEIGVAFDHITANIGINSQRLLKDLQAASEGTIANFDLIKISSNALIGVSGTLGKALGEKLPELLKIAKVQADATGKSVDELFNSLAEGIKRGTPKLIEGTGLIIDQKAAYQAYAETLGITVAQLSDTDKSMALLNATLVVGAQSIDALAGSAESNSDKIDRINATLTNTVDGLAIAVQPVFGAILDGVQQIVNVFAGFAPYLAIIFNFVGGVIAKIVTKLANIIPPDLPKRMFEGAAAAFGSFANAIIQVANTLIFPAVIAIAKFIADFLIGFSPPKLGPLSKIDQGGANLMMAWLDGIAGVSLDPVEQVAQQVSDALGAIGRQSLVQVNARLAQLDKALLPFQNRLDIIKAQFDALNEPAQLALDAIDREVAKLQDAVAQGDAQAIERLRLLDQQRDAIQGQVDLQQGLVDGAQIQLGLARAQQAPERALLNIRQAYLAALMRAQGPAPATGGAGAGAASRATATGGAGGVVAPSGGGAVGGGIVPSGASVLDLVGGQDAIDTTVFALQEAFSGAIDPMGQAQFDQNVFDLSAQINKIKTVDIGAKITDKFKGLSDAFDPSVAGSIANNLWQFFNGGVENPNSLAGIADGLGKSLNLEAAKARIEEAFAWILDPSIDGSPANVFATLTGDSSVENSVAWFFATLPQKISDAVAGIGPSIKANVLDPISNFLVGDGPGTLSDIINQTVGFFINLPLRIVDALRGIGASVYTALAVPVINAINGLITMVENGVKLLINKIAEFAESIANALGASAPQFLRDTIGSLRGAASGISFGRISTELPAFLQGAPLAGATGGIFSKGFMTVGERGKELVYNAAKMGVVPNEITNVLLALESILAQPQPMPIYSGGNTSNSNTTNSTFNFNGVSSDKSARQRYNILRAGMR